MNKIDLVSKDVIEERASIVRDLPTISISARTGEGTKKLRTKIVQSVFEENDYSGIQAAGQKIVSGTPIQSIDQKQNVIQL